MKKYTFILACLAMLMGFANSAQAQCDDGSPSCKIHVLLHDSYGDGWNNNGALSVYQGDSLLGLASLPSGSDTELEYEICTSGDSIFIYCQNIGQWASETDVTIIDGMEEVVVNAQKCNTFTTGSLVAAFPPACTNCPKPADLTLTEVGVSTATFTWTESGSATTWVYNVSASATPTGTWQTTTSPTATITGLTDNTPYRFFVRSVCGAGDTSGKATIDFRTECDAITSLPLVQDFENYGEFPYCWDIYESLQGSYSSYPNISTSAYYSGIGTIYPTSGSYGVYMVSYGTSISTSSPVSFISPRIDVPASDVEITLWAAGNDSLHICYTTSNDPDAELHPITRIMPDAQMRQYTVALKDYTLPSSYYLVFRKKVVLSTVPLFIDDIVLRQYKDCAVPTNVRLGEGPLATGTAYVAWDDATSTTWQVGYVPSGYGISSSEAQFVVVSGSPSATITGLSDDEEYDFYVRAICGSDTGYWSPEYCTTRPNTYVIEEGEHTMQLCGGTITDDGGPFGGHGYGDGKEYILTLQPADESTSVTLEGYYSLSSTTTATYQTKLRIYDGADTTGRLMLDAIGSDYNVSLVAESGTFTVVFKHNSYNSSYYQFDGFDFEVGCTDRPSCYSVYDAELVDLTGKSCRLNWSYYPGLNPDNFSVKVFDEDDSLYVQDIELEGTLRTYLLEGLQERKHYTITIASLCGGVVGLEKAEFHIETECIVGGGVMVGETGGTTSYYALTPYGVSSMSQSLYTDLEIEGVDTITSIRLYMASGTPREVNLSIYMNDTQAKTLTSSDYEAPDTVADLYFHGKVDFTPGEVTIDLDKPYVHEEGKNLLLTLLRNVDDDWSSSSWYFYTNVSSDGGGILYANDYNDQIDLEDVYPTTPWTSASRPTVRFIAPCGDPSCAPVTITSVEAGQYECTIAWNPGFEETSWAVEYKASNDATWTTFLASTTEQSVTITGLDAGTDYRVRILSLCGDRSTPRAINVSTLCGPMKILPIIENFESFQLSSSATGAIQNCWSRYLTNPSYYTAYPYVNSSTTTAYNGSGYLYLSYSNTTYSGLVAGYLITPEIEEPLANVGVSFMGCATSYPAICEVGVCTDPEDPSTFELIDEVEIPMNGYGNYTYNPYRVSLDDYTGNATHIYITIRANEDYSYGILYMDSLAIFRLPDCRDIKDVQLVNVRGTGLDFLVEDKYDRNNYTVYYSLTESISDAQTFTATSKNISLTGLTTNAEYHIWVQANCDNDKSELYNFGAVRTACDPIAVTAAAPYFTELEEEDDLLCMWTSNIQTSTEWVATSRRAYSGNYSLNYGTKADGVSQVVLPSFDFSGLDTIAELSFYRLQTIDTTKDPAVAEVFYRTTDNGEWTKAATVPTVEASNNWEKVFVTLPGSKGTSFYQVAIRVTANRNLTGIYIDDLKVDAATLCLPPTSLVISDITSRTAKATFTGNLIPNVRLQYKEENALSWTSRTIYDDNEGTLTPLEPSTTYICRATTVCGKGMYSEPTPIVTFTTPICAERNEGTNIVASSTKKVVPNTLLNSNYDEGAYNYAEVIIEASKLSDLSSIEYFSFYTDSVRGGDGLNNCTVVMGTTSLNEYTGSFAYNNDFKVVYEGSLCYNTTGEQRFKLQKPYEYSGTGNLVVGIYVYGYLGSPYYTYFYDSSYVTSSQTNANRFIAVHYQYNFDLDELEYVPASTVVTSDIVPDITVAGCKEMCYEPVLKDITTTSSSMTITWYSEKNMTVEASIRPTGSTAWDTKTITGINKVTFDELPAMTKFDVQLRRDCSASSVGFSDYTTATATTDTACSLPEGIHATEVGATTATLAWTSGAVATKWEIHVWNEGFDQYYTVNTNPATITGLVPGSSYRVQVRAFCGSDDHVVGDWSETATFQNTCDPVTGLSANVQGHTVTLTWVGAALNQKYFVSWGLKDFDPNDQIGYATVEGTTYTISDLSKAETYTFRVRGICGDGWNSVPAETNGVIVGIDDVDGQNAQFTLQPNPATEVVSISLEQFEGTATVSIMSVDGRQLSQFSTVEANTTLDLSSYATGTYFVRVQTNGWTSVRKLIVK